MLDGISGRETFRRRSIMHLTSAMLVGNAAITTRRQLRSSQVTDDVSARRDTAIAVLTLVGEGLARSNRFRYPGGRPGTDYAPIAAALGAAEFSDLPQRRQALSGLVATIWATTSAGRPDGTGVSITSAVTDIAGTIFSANLAGWFLAVLRESARVVRDAYDLEVAEAVRVEQLQERARQRRLLHDSVLQVFEAVAANLNLDADDALALLERELARLVSSVEGATRALLSDGIEELRTFATALGLSLTWLGDRDVEASGPSIDALIDAAREALTNIRKHATVSTAALTIRHRDHGVELTIEDHGTGFDRANITHGFGLGHSIEKRLETVGGTSTVHTAPGHGTNVTLWVPC